MYEKRIIILQQTDSRFAETGKELCGMVKIVNATQTTVTLFVTNADIKSFGQWWLLLSFGGKEHFQQLKTFNNDTFTLPLKNLQNVSCLLVKKEDEFFPVAQGQLGPNNCCGELFVSWKNSQSDATPYEQFVSATENFYGTMDVDALKTEADNRYKSVRDYSAAFERYYAAGGQENYYQTVKREIGKVFLQFPPYYPLIRRYSQSFFVRIDFPLSEKYFVLGLLQQNGVVRYICYGLPAEKKTFVDKDFVWVENQPTGFWMLFQDAITGQITTLKETV